MNTQLTVPNYGNFSSSHAVPHVTLSPVSITVRESAGMVTVRVIRSGDITSGRSIVYFNTRSTATGGATGMGMLLKYLPTRSKLYIIDLHMTGIIYDLCVIITPPQDAQKKLVLQVYPGLNILKSRPTCDLDLNGVCT